MSSEKTPAESRRARTLVAAAILLASGIGLGVAGSQIVKSPESAALENAPPSLPPATATVEEGVLGESTVVDAEFAANDDRLVPTADRDGIVTFVPDLGATVFPGDVVLEVSGRPIIVLSGSLYPYRDFTGGTQGDDVRVLQTALTSLGLNVGPIDGLYGAQTASAVEDLYRARGYEPPAASASAAKVQAARAQVASTSAALRDLRQQAADAAADADPSTNVDPADIAVAAAALSLAQESLTAVRDASLTPMPSDEVIFLEGAAFEIVESSALVGQPALRGLITLAPGTSRTLWATVPRSVAARLTPGTPVVVTIIPTDSAGANPEPVDGTITWIATSVGNAGVKERFGDAFSVPEGQVGIEMTLEATMTRLEVTRLSATIEIGAGGDPTLIVPLSAIRTSADGGAWVAVLVQNAAGELETHSVTVTVLDSLSGRASVRSDDLHAGDDVVIP